MNVFDLFRLEGKVALITGGGRGLGEQIAQAYVEAGAKVILCSLRVEKCDKVKEELEAQGGEAYALALDVTQPDSVEEAVAKPMERFGRIDIVFNNSGTSWGAPALEMPYDAWMKVMQTNLTGTFLMSQTVGKQMQEQGGDKIVNIASVARFRSRSTPWATAPVKAA